MFRLHRNRPAKSGERIDFKFSDFKALQVPKGWEKLFISVIAIETGKTIAKSSKASVHNGGCQWDETLAESFWLSQNDFTKELDDCHLKLVVAKGSARSGILGEIIVNMISFTESTALVQVSLPLKKCNYGTILQVKIQCMTSRTKIRDGELRDTNLQMGDSNISNQDLDIHSNESDSTLARSTGSSSVKDVGLGSTLHPGEARSTEASFSGSGSHPSYCSAEGSVNSETLSPQNNLQNTKSRGNFLVQGPSQLIPSFSNIRTTGSGNHSQNGHEELAPSSLKVVGPSKNLLEAAEDAIEELRAEALMWERNARKLMLELEISRKEFSHQSKNQESSKIELSEAYAERDGLMKEVEQLKMLLEKSMERQTAIDDSPYQVEGVPFIQKELQDELKFQKESNADLALQLKRSQEANIELVSVLQELEETIDKQKSEMENLSELQSRFNDMENSLQTSTEENQKLLLELQELQESEKILIFKVQSLEQNLEGNNVTENNKSADNKTSLHESVVEMGLNGVDVNPAREIEVLKEKVQELERDCNELTDENLELLYKLKEANNNSMRGIALQGNKVWGLEGRQKEECNDAIENNDDDHLLQEFEILKTELESKIMELSGELTEKQNQIAKLGSDLLGKEEERGFLQQMQRELQGKYSDLQSEKIQLEEQVEVMLRESDITSKCLNALRNDIMVLSSSTKSHISANKMLERKSSELESRKFELELHISVLEQENKQLSEKSSTLEAQLRQLEDNRGSIQSELENSKSYILDLQGEVSRLKMGMENEKEDLKQKLNDLQNRYLEVQEENEYLKVENPKLQAAVESLSEECSSLQKSNGKLKKQKLELQEHCSLLEDKLEESQKSFSNCAKKVEELEENFSSVLESLATKEKVLTSELDILLEDNMKQKEKLVLGESLLNQMYMEKKVEVQSLQEEIEHLTKQLSVSNTERDGMQYDNAKLESQLEEVQSRLKSTENELQVMQVESETKLPVLIDELALSTQNREILLIENEKMSKSLENYKSDESKFKTVINDLELKLTVSEYERQQLMEESTKMKAEMDKLSDLQDELYSKKCEKEKLEVALKTVFEECEDLKMEKISFVETIPTLEKAASELEECKRIRVSLEEKILNMEGNLVAKEALSSSQEAELKNELNRIRRANNQYQKKIKLLEEEKDECSRRCQALDEEIKSLKEEKQKQRVPGLSKTNGKPGSSHISKLQKNEMGKNTSQSQSVRRRPSSRNGLAQELVNQRENNHGSEIQDESSSLGNGVDPSARIQLLENELAEAVEANKKYKLELSRIYSEGESKEANNGPKKSTVEGEVVAKEKFERTKSSLETELRELRERYFHMSLQYAEVEAQREELVMKLKSGKKWFS